MSLNKLPLSLLTTTENPADGAYIKWDAAAQKIVVSETYLFQGSVSGYSVGGFSSLNIIDKFPLSTDTNATDVGDLAVASYLHAGQSSSSHGYTAGTDYLGGNSTQKFPFATDGNAVSVGSLTQARNAVTGQAYVVAGYTSGGSAPVVPSPGVTNTIDKFPFSSDASSTDVGDLSQSRNNLTGQSSTTHGYSAGGFLSPATATNRIDRFPFATDANAATVGSLSQSRWGASGQSSTTRGYTSGGRTPSYVNTIDKFSFSSFSNATDVGNLLATGAASAGQTSTVSGYNSGGTSPTRNVISKFPFATDANASDVGDLTLSRYYISGNQK